MVGTDISAVALRLREGERELIEVEAREYTGGRADTMCGIVQLRACRGRSFSEIGRPGTFTPPRIYFLTTRRSCHAAPPLQLTRAGVCASDGRSAPPTRPVHVGV